MPEASYYPNKAIYLHGQGFEDFLSSMIIDICKVVYWVYYPFDVLA